MPTITKGTIGRFETVGSTVKIGNFRTDEPEGATIKYQDTKSDPARLDYFKSGSYKYGQFKSATSTYENGSASGEVIYESKTIDVTHKMNVSTTSEPIDTHPDFRTRIGGTEDNPKNQAIFEDKAFRKFPRKYSEANEGEFPEGAKEGDQNRYAGVQSYLSASGTWTRSITTNKSPTLKGLGKISTPTGNPPTPAGRNWLYTGFSATYVSPARSDATRTLEGRITQNWRLSSRRGWDKDIYGEVKAGDGNPLHPDAGAPQLNNFNWNV